MATPTETDESGQRQGGGGGGGGGSKNAFMRKLGPLPLWAWMGIGLALALVVSLWSSNKKKSTDKSASDSDDSSGDSTADQTPPFIIQNYTTYPPAPSSPAASPPASTTPVTLPAGGTTTKPPTKPPVNPSKPTGTAKPKAEAYKVKPGDTLSKIAAKYGTTVDKIWKYNTGTGAGTANRPASTRAELIKRGKDLLYSNETIYIPPK